MAAPDGYADTYSVKECFQAPKFTPGFKADSIAPNRVLKGIRIWRSVSLENRENQLVLNGTNKCEDMGLLEIIKFGVFEKGLHVFSSDDFNDAARTRIDKKTFKTLLLLNDSISMPAFDEKGEPVASGASLKKYLMGNDIKSYLIKEDWITNSYSGKTEKYIVGIAPLVYDSKTEKTVPLFWIYYPEWKSLLSAFKAKNVYTHEGINFAEVFAKRLFVSQISKESNVFDRGIKAYKHGSDTYLESELIKEKLNNAESDLFQH
ncbi:hypothetical protein CNR22_15175 [Sphingobacteriaceae bacterium]|nr:hypothetical protein CNR22_15175 [Sphingobacteriaceae bacterium]